MRYLESVLEFLFGCHHESLSRVFTIGGSSYRVCCSCGARFDYSLKTMSIGGRDLSQPVLSPREVVGVEASPRVAREVETYPRFHVNERNRRFQRRTRAQHAHARYTG